VNTNYYNLNGSDVYQFRKRMSYVKAGYMYRLWSVAKEVSINSIECLTDGVNSQRASAHRSITLVMQWSSWYFKGHQLV
jgi:hypothetical protein